MVRTSAGGTSILLHQDALGTDLQGSVLFESSRNSMLERVESQMQTTLGLQTSVFLAFETQKKYDTIRVYACPMEERTFAQFNLRVTQATKAADLQNRVFDKDNPGKKLILASVAALQGLKLLP